MTIFELRDTFGHHNIYKIDTSKHNFLQYFIDLYKYDNLQQLHTISSSCPSDNLSDKETDLHQIFYNNIKQNDQFKQLYCNLIKDIYDNLFPEETVYIYQSFPSIRIQYFNNTVIPPHCDSDKLGNHPVGEKNFILPITKMYGTNRVFIESEPDKKDFKGIDMDYGDLFYFNGNKCTHYNEKNIEDNIRISLDFRIILLKDYKNYIDSNSIVFTNPRDKRIPVKMTIGGYYQMCFKNQNTSSDDFDIISTMTNSWYSNKQLIMQTRPNFDINEANACYEYMKTGDNFVTEFKQTQHLEKMICDFTGAKYCSMITSGTTALIAAFLALDIGKNDDVIVPNYTMIASINAIKIIGANPIIVDVDIETGTITKEIIDKSMTEKTKAVLHVSLNNRTKHLQEIVEYCNDKNVFLVEDAAQSLGCFLNKKHIGTFGLIGCFSLSTPKIISTGQGGFLLTDNEELYKKINMIKNFGRKEGGSEVYEIFGLNLKFTDIQAVIGIEQMKKLPYRIRRMREIFDLYYNELLEIRHVCKMIPPMNDEWIPWFIDIFVEDRDSLIDYLKQHNIQTRVTYPQINKTPMYNNDNLLTNSEYISTCGIFLPSHTLLTDSDIHFICKIIKLYFITKIK
jgi:perosamine synthetase